MKRVVFIFFFFILTTHMSFVQDKRIKDHKFSQLDEKEGYLIFADTIFIYIIGVPKT